MACRFQGISPQITRCVFQLNAGMAYMNWKRSLEISSAVGEFIWKRCILIPRQESCQTIRKYGQLLSEEYTEEGIKVTAYVPAELFAGLYGDGPEK